MPYDIKRNYGGCRGYAVVGPHGTHGCHTTRASAIQQQRALYAAEAQKSLDSDLEKASKVKNGDIVSWNSSGGRATGRVEHVMRSGTLGIPGTEFSINATEEDPAVLIRIYRDGKPTETLVGHKMSTLDVVNSKSHDGIIDNTDTPNKNPHSMEDCTDPNCEDHMAMWHDKKKKDEDMTKEYDSKERRVLARQGRALPDGSFPIVTVGDLRNAIQSVGRASNYSQARNHIIRRAEALNRTDLLPEEWKPKSAKKSLEIEKRAVSDIDLKPTDSMAANARRGLELRDKFNRGGTAVGVARARDLANQRDLSPETVARMYSFFSRHEVDKQGKDWDNAERPSNGKIAWLLWGGDSGYAWAKQKWEAIQNARASKSDETWKDSPFSFYK